MDTNKTPSASGGVFTVRMDRIYMGMEAKYDPTGTGDTFSSGEFKRSLAGSIGSNHQGHSASDFSSSLPYPNRMYRTVSRRIRSPSGHCAWKRFYGMDQMKSSTVDASRAASGLTIVNGAGASPLPWNLTNAPRAHRPQVQSILQIHFVM